MTEWIMICYLLVICLEILDCTGRSRAGYLSGSSGDGLEKREDLQPLA